MPRWLGVLGWLATAGCVGRGIDALPGAELRDRSLDAALWAAAGRGPTEAEPWVNRLILEPSVYLRQHAHDPVDWWPWGDAAFARARALDRPVLVSIGYATCHWCHVMGHESFRDLVIARTINARYVAVKVDRELRPDVDDVYLAALRAMTGSGGGWPMTLIVTPDGTPVFAGTYLPARDGDRGAAVGLETVLARIADGWATDRAALLAEADANSRALADATRPTPPGTVPGPEVVADGIARFRAGYDEVHGGFGRGAKFPRTPALDLLLASPDPAARSLALGTLDALAASAVHD
ncbi:MAG: DUF255 domain-containing protein, partial [Myxococcota bacterium]